MPRARTEQLYRAPRRVLEQLEGFDRVPGAPRTRGECVDGPRPCPWMACRHHLATEVSGFGRPVVVFPDLELDELMDTCSLDVADGGPRTLEEIGERLNLTRERLRQLEQIALAKYHDRLEALGPRAVDELRDHLEDLDEAGGWR